MAHYFYDVVTEAGVISEDLYFSEICQVEAFYLWYSEKKKKKKVI